MSPGFLDESWISAWFTQICFWDPCHGNCYWLLAPNIQIASPMSTPSSPVGKKSFPNRSPRKYKRRGAKCTRPTLSGSTSINYKPSAEEKDSIGFGKLWTKLRQSHHPAFSRIFSKFLTPDTSSHSETHSLQELNTLYLLLEEASLASVEVAIQLPRILFIFF